MSNYSLFFLTNISLILKAGDEDNKENDGGVGDERSKYEINIDYANNTDNYTIRSVIRFVSHIFRED